MACPVSLVLQWEREGKNMFPCVTKCVLIPLPCPSLTVCQQLWLGLRGFSTFNNLKFFIFYLHFFSVQLSVEHVTEEV